MVNILFFCSLDLHRTAVVVGVDLEDEDSVEDLIEITRRLTANIFDVPESAVTVTRVANAEGDPYSSRNSPN